MGDLTYEYDKAGNRTKIGGSWARTGIPQAVSTASYNAANHQLTFGNKSMGYDLNGNLQTITDPSGTTTYTWNTRNQLASIGGPVTANFVYDGTGRREKKTINGTLTEFLYDGLNPVQETSGTPVTANMLTGLGIDEFLARTDISTGLTISFLTDALGSTVALTDGSGTIQTEYNYEPFGNTTTTGAANSNSFQYTGRENESISIYAYRNRFYNPALQRFISEDPYLRPTYWQCFNSSLVKLRPPLSTIAGNDPQTLNPYLYVGNNPTKYIDPFGLEKITSCQGSDGCPCGQRVGTDWECLTIMGLGNALATGLPLGLLGAASMIKLGPVFGPVGLIGTALTAAWVGYFYVWLPCQRCVPT